MDNTDDPTSPPRDLPPSPGDAPSAASASELLNHGVACSRRGQHHEALWCYREACRLDPGLAEAHANAGNALRDLERLDEAIVSWRQALALKPALVVTRRLLGTHLAAFGDNADAAEALAILDPLVEADPGDHEARFCRGIARFARGDYRGAWPDLEARLPGPIPGAPPRWDGRPLSGTLLLDATPEGRGDCLQGLRFAAEVRRRVGSLVLCCPPSLARLAARVAGIDRVVTDPVDIGPVDAQITPLSLVGLVAPEPQEWGGDPYLSAEAAHVARFRALLEAATGFKLAVGVAWQGDPQHMNDRNRSFPLTAMAPLADVGRVGLISLQKGRGSEQLATSPFHVLDLGQEFAVGDMWATAHVIRSLDLVVTLDSAIAHLAGALGVPTWIASSAPPEWRYRSPGGATSWYRSARIFTQDRPGDWRGVFERMAEELRSFPSRSKTST